MRMRSALVYALTVIAAALFIAGCVPKTKPTEEARPSCQPKNLQVDAGNGMLDVYWQDNCTGLKSGYNIYISEKPLLGDSPEENAATNVRPFNPSPYPGDTNPDDAYQHFIAEGLDNGKKYYVSVRVVNADRTMSGPSNEALAIPGPRGDIELAVRYKAGEDGYSFERNEYVRADASDNDLYYYTLEGNDYLASPDRLNGFLKKNRLLNLNSRAPFSIIRGQLSDVKPSVTQDRVKVNSGEWFLLRTEADTFALIRVTGFTGSGDQRRVKLFFAYDPAPGELVF